MSARDVIAVTIHCSSETAFAEDIADAILAALSGDGYRILAPGELDSETLEAAAGAVEDAPWFDTKNCRWRNGSDYADAVRNLKDRSAG